MLLFQPPFFVLKKLTILIRCDFYDNFFNELGTCLIYVWINVNIYNSHKHKLMGRLCIKICKSAETKGLKTSNIGIIFNSHNILFMLMKFQIV